MPRIVSWNTLFRPYEEEYNPSSRILSSYPNEWKRTVELTRRIMKYVDCNTIICLQECSAELVKMLRESVKNANVFFERAGTAEYIVIIAPIGFSKENWKKKKFFHGLLVVSNEKYRIFNCHLVPQRYSETDNMGYVNNFPRDKITIVAGDFNEHFKAVASKLKDRYTVPQFGKTYKKKQIDHIVIDRDMISSIRRVENMKDISDHNAIAMVFRVDVN